MSLSSSFRALESMSIESSTDENSSSVNDVGIGQTILAEQG